jgi:beta-lactamase regulating signal transducer with metallopeptidase domain
VTDQPSSAEPKQPIFEPPEKSTIKDMLTIAWVLSLIVGIILLITGLFSFGITAILGIVDLVVFYECREIIKLIDQKRLSAAKEKTLIWMIVGLIFGFIIVGIFMVIAYLKFDDLIRSYQNSAKEQPQ